MIDILSVSRHLALQLKNAAAGLNPTRVRPHGSPMPPSRPLPEPTTMFQIGNGKLYGRAACRLGTAAPTGDNRD